MISKLKKATDTLGELALVYLVVILVAATVFSVAENKNMLDAVYWAGITATSVGYGDVTPASQTGKVVAVLLSHTTILFILPLLIARLATSFIDNEDQFTDQEQEYILKALDDLKHGQKALWDRMNEDTMQQQSPQDIPELKDKAPHEEAFFRTKDKDNAKESGTLGS